MTPDRTLVSLNIPQLHCPIARLPDCLIGLTSRSSLCNQHSVLCSAVGAVDTVAAARMVRAGSRRRAGTDICDRTQVTPLKKIRYFSGIGNPQTIPVRKLRRSHLAMTPSGERRSTATGQWRARSVYISVRRAEGLYVAD